MPSLLIVIRSYRDGDRDDVVALWEDCGLLRPWNDPDKDICRKQAVQSHLFLVAELDDRIVGSAMAGYDGHRGWVNYLATDPAHRHQGIATMVMEAVEKGLAEMGCPKINIQIRADNVQAAKFYESIGFTGDDIISMGKRLEAD
jgi:ribosomal protein S18 acetylase RimI-like enzyme